MDILAELDLSITAAQALYLDCQTIVDAALIDHTYKPIEVVQYDFNAICYFGLPWNHSDEDFLVLSCGIHITAGILRYYRQYIAGNTYLRVGWFNGARVKGRNRYVYVPPGVTWQCNFNGLIKNGNSPNPIVSKSGDKIRYIDDYHGVRSIQQPTYDGDIWYDVFGNAEKVRHDFYTVCRAQQYQWIPMNRFVATPSIDVKISWQKDLPLAELTPAQPVQYILLNDS